MLNKKIFFLLFLAVTLSSCTGYFFVNKTVKKGKIAYHENDFDTAFELFDKVAERNQKSAEAFYFRAKIYEMRNQPQNALSDFKKSFQLSNNKAITGLIIGKILFDRKIYDESLLYLAASYKSDSTNLSTVYYLMLTLSATGNSDKSFLLYERAPERDTSWQLNYAIAVAADSLEMLDFAELYYRKSTRLNRSNSDTYIALCKLLIKREKYDEALRFATNGVRYTNNVEFHKIRLEIFEKQQRWQEAMSEATTLYNMTNDIDFIIKRAKIFQNAGLFNNALNDFTFVLSIDSINSTALFSRALINSRLVNKEIALEDFTNYLKLDTTKLDPHHIITAKFLVSRLASTIPPPVIDIIKPVVFEKVFLGIDSLSDTLIIRGKIFERAKLDNFFINKVEVKGYEQGFSVQIPFPDNDSVVFETVDMFGNIFKQHFKILKIEDSKPEIIIIYPKIENNNLANIEIESRFMKTKFRCFDKNYISNVIVNRDTIYKVSGINTVLIDTVIPVPTDNKINIEVKNTFGHSSHKNFKINKITAPLTQKNKNDILVLIFNGKQTSTNETNKITDQIISLLSKSINVDIQISQLADNKSIQRYLIFDLPQLVENKKYIDVLIFFTGMGIEEKVASYWLPAKSDVNDKTTWFNFSFLQSVSSIIRVDGNLAFISNSVFLPERFLGNEISDENIQTLFVKVLNNGFDLLFSELQNAYENKEIVDFISLLETISKKKQKYIEIGWLNGFAKKRDKPALIVW